MITAVAVRLGISDRFSSLRPVPPSFRVGAAEVEGRGEGGEGGGLKVLKVNRASLVRDEISRDEVFFLLFKILTTRARAFDLRIERWRLKIGCIRW